MRTVFSRLACSILVLALVPACSRGTTGEAPPETAGAEEESDPNAQRMMTLDPESPDEGMGPCALQSVYFAYDSDELTQASREAIATAVECLRERRQARLHITGATDPRGSEEYNLALGERRAQAVRSYLTSLGIEGARIGVSSVGEELARGEDEAGYARDRRADTRVDE
ncbi:MAG: OmpA family protein [Sandaracinaceae bacterium]